jgi:hypothetical protein
MIQSGTYTGVQALRPFNDYQSRKHCEDTIVTRIRPELSETSASKRSDLLMEFVVLVSARPVS